MRTRWNLAGGALAALTLVGAMAPSALGVRLLDVPEPAQPPTSSEAIERAWDEILEGAVSDGEVNYARLASRRASLERLVGALAVTGPHTSPGRFESRAQRLAYFINAYNILVVWAVIARDVRTTVQDVHGWLDPLEGLGFFWSQRFELDGETVSLHGLENDLLRGHFDEPRIHAAINCASVSCPSLRSRAFRAASLDDALDEVTRAFTASPHVVVDEANRRVELSAIYHWYAEDFAPDPLTWIQSHAASPEPLSRARAGGWPVRYSTYDWALNGHW